MPDYVRVELIDDISKSSNKGKLFKKHCEIKYEINSIGMITGLVAYLPESSSSIEDVDIKEIKKYISTIDKKLEGKMIPVFLCDELKEIYEIEINHYGCLINLILIDDVLEYMIIKHKLEIKKLKLLIIDDGSWRFVYILKRLYKYLNYVSIVSDRVDELKDIVDEILRDTGLVISMYVNPLRQNLDIDIAINLDKSDNWNFNFLNGNVIIYDLGVNESRNMRIQSVNKHIRIYSKVVLKSLKVKIPNDLLGDMAYLGYDVIRQFANGRTSGREQFIIDEIFSLYAIEFAGIS